MAYLGQGPCAKEMYYRSPFVNKLNQQILESNQAQTYCHIATKTDILVIPYQSQLMKKNPRAFRHTFERCGHVTALFSNRGVDLILDYMRGVEGDFV